MVITVHLSLSSTTALAAAIVAAASVLAFSQLPDLPVWAAFIGWASYDHSGATPRAAVRSSTALTFGVVIEGGAGELLIAGPSQPDGASHVQFELIESHIFPLQSQQFSPRANRSPPGEQVTIKIWVFDGNNNLVPSAPVLLTCSCLGSISTPR